MSFCSNCGHELGEVKGGYCPMCGQKISDMNTATGNGQTGAMDYEKLHRSMNVQVDAYRKVSMDRLLTMYEYFLPKADNYKRVNELEEQIPKLEKRKVACRTWGIISFVVAFLFFISIFDSGAVIGMILMTLLFAVLGYFLIRTWKKQEDKRKMNLAQAQQEQSQLIADLKDHYNKSGYANTIGFEFSNPVILQTLWGTVRDGRANAINEAIQVLIQDLRNEKQEMQNQEMIRQIRSNRKWAIANTGISAANLGVSTFHLGFDIIDRLL